MLHSSSVLLSHCITEDFIKVIGGPSSVDMEVFYKVVWAKQEAGKEGKGLKAEGATLLADPLQSRERKVTGGKTARRPTNRPLQLSMGAKDSYSQGLTSVEFHAPVSPLPLTLVNGRVTSRPAVPLSTHPSKKNGSRGNFAGEQDLGTLAPLYHRTSQLHSSFIMPLSSHI